MRSALFLILVLSFLPATAQDTSGTGERPTPQLRATGEQPADPTVLELRGLDAERATLMRELRVARAMAIDEAVEANRLKARGARRAFGRSDPSGPAAGDRT